MDKIKRIIKTLLKIILGIAVFVVFLVFLGQLVIYYYNDLAFNCRAISGDYRIQECYQKYAVGFNDAKICFSFDRGMVPDKLSCVDEVALKNDSIKACDSVNFDNLIELHPQNRRRYGDFSPIEDQMKTAGAWRQNCISNYAKQKKDPSICQLVSDPYIKENCINDSK